MAKWYDYLTLWQLACQKFGRQNMTLDMEQYYAACYDTHKRNKKDPRAYHCAIETQNEYQWVLDKKPYYRIYPGVITPFLRIDIDKVDLGSLKVPTNSTILIQIPVGSIVVDGIVLRNIMLTSIRTKEHRESADVEGMFVKYEYSKEGSNNGAIDTFNSQFTLPFVSGRLLGTYLGDKQRIMGDLNAPIAMRNNVLRIIAVCSLLENDPDVIQPDVLNDDLEKFKQTLDPKYVEKAKRRGKFGWVIGRDIEVSPHIRAASPFALYWTGKGRTIPIIRHRKGCIVHRELVEKVPTGFDGE